MSENRFSGTTSYTGNLTIDVGQLKFYDKNEPTAQVVADLKWSNEVDEREKLKKQNEKLKKQMVELQTENSRLRATLAKSKLPCIYCGIEEMGKCTAGFPGCGRMDDLMCDPDVEYPEDAIPPQSAEGPLFQIDFNPEPEKILEVMCDPEVGNGKV
jgi:hypothetical protein